MSSDQTKLYESIDIWDTLTHCGLVMRYGDIDLGNTWSNVGLSSIEFSSIHLGAIPLEVIKLSQNEF